jgi:hypothetical protein
MILGLAALVCAFGTLASPALAKKKAHPQVLGKFVASYPSGRPISESWPTVARGVGDEELIELAEGALTIGPERCEKISSVGGIDWERSDTLYQRIAFTGCWGTTYVGTAKHIFEEVKIPKFVLAMEFHSNGFGETGEGEASMVHIDPTSVFIKPGKGASCTIVIPAQTIPVKAIKKPESEFEAASYETEDEPAKIKRFPSGFQEELDISMEFKKVVTEVEGSEHCHVGPHFKGSNGIIEAELEEVKIKKGNLGFRDKEEVEAEEKV